MKWQLKSHVAQWGCYWNRNIPALVKDLNLEVVEYRLFSLLVCNEISFLLLLIFFFFFFFPSGGFT